MEKAEYNLKGKTVVITGATSGVGLAAVEAFAQQGCNIVAAARGSKGIGQVLEYCRSVNVKAVGISADVSLPQDVEKIAQQALAINGKIDIWVNNAGVMASGRFEEIPMEIHQQVLRTNLFGYMHGAYNAIKIFKRQNYGILINNVSIGGFMPAPYSAVYSASKHGIKGMMEGLQGEIANNRNIHICNLYPQLQNSTGNLHSAKYSGFDMDISPIASDPRDTAAVMVSLAKHPRKDVFPDFRSSLITHTYKLFPKLINNGASAVVRMRMDSNTDKKDDPGNILAPSKEPLRIHGRPPVKNMHNLAYALIAGLGIGAALLWAAGKPKPLS
ncbi:SDR family NAD(P)-dependent oxidoreductase [Flavobacterium sharifuzzamanii]|uniref:SDR family NAD(P)-dependent oxidoreductase n=1 Tax=Flavobacterium sharifuzzamanii TaxID=2211133 RepID=UPI000DAB9F98|nr:SDR family NAD(P)-dependent oxidoreductase [Flavobacterium sharifuzzamanii]KAF2080086.1 SDR family NAD(P)-dependent oxidoreductase [Flavobacterium sharifuzzamanii]